MNFTTFYAIVYALFRVLMLFMESILEYLHVYVRYGTYWS